jgi:hypothetical protein
VSVSCRGWDDAFESLDSFATWSVMPIAVSVMRSSRVSARELLVVELTASGLFFFGVDGHVDGFGLGVSWLVWCCWSLCVLW